MTLNIFKLFKHSKEDELVASVDQLRADIAALKAIVPKTTALIELLEAQISSGNIPDDVATDLESAISDLKTELDKFPDAATPPAAPPTNPGGQGVAG